MMKYTKAKNFLRAFGLETKQDYLDMHKSANLPEDPEEFYKDEWEGWEAFLTTLSFCGKRRKPKKIDLLMDEWFRKPQIL